MLSDKVQELIKKSRIVSFDSWQDCSPEIVKIFQQADDDGRYLTDQDIREIEAISPELSASLTQGKILRDNVEEIVSQAREVVIASNPQLIEPGGGLYPPARAEACWRDFWHFLRCITYGISGKSVNYTSDRGLGYMEELYQELEVPLGPMILGLEQLKFFSLQKLNSSNSSSTNSFPEQDLEPYFDQLIESLGKFTPIS